MEIVLNKFIDHTLLKSETTHEDIIPFCKEATELGVYAVCVLPTFVATAKGFFAAEHSIVKVATVCGFPTGAHKTAVKVKEAELSVQDGADEIDMVVNLGDVKSGNWEAVEKDIAAVRAACKNIVLKVIIESSALTDHEITTISRICEAAGADFVKTSTGLHSTGGATVHAVELIKKTVGDRLGIKASGGIRTLPQALELVEAGATRLGMGAASSAEILKEYELYK